jgi:hypothetical protein
MTDDFTQARNDDQARAEYTRATFGDDALEGLAVYEPATRRTADKLASASLAAAAERQRAEDAELLEVAAAEQAEDDALDEALRVMRRGKGAVTRGTLRKAGRALKRRGYHQGSTAERLARMAGQGEGWRSA